MTRPSATSLCWTVALMMAGCVSVPTQYAYVNPLQGQSDATRDQDKSECYRLAQAGLSAYGQAPASGAPLLGAVSGAAHGAMVGVASGRVGQGAVGGSLAGFGAGVVASIVSAELHDAATRPADLMQYQTCLSGRGYDVQWPRGRGPR